VKNVTVKLTQQEQHQISMECKRNPKKIWQYVNRHTKSETEIGNLKQHDTNGDEKVAESDCDKATILQNFVSLLYTVESDDFDTLPSRMDVQVDRTTFTVTEDDISKKLIQLKIDKSPGPDLIHPRVLDETHVRLIIRPLFLIFRKSLKFGTLPTDWKLAEVTAVHKKGSKSEIIDLLA